MKQSIANMDNADIDYIFSNYSTENGLSVDQYIRQQYNASSCVLQTVLLQLTIAVKETIQYGKNNLKNIPFDSALASMALYFFAHYNIELQTAAGGFDTVIESKTSTPSIDLF